jgi:hypothetical protein
MNSICWAQQCTRPKNGNLEQYNMRRYRTLEFFGSFPDCSRYPQLYRPSQAATIIARLPGQGVDPLTLEAAIFLFGNRESSLEGENGIRVNIKLRATDTNHSSQTFRICSWDLFLATL